jgi:hypothetical protein
VARELLAYRGAGSTPHWKPAFMPRPTFPAGHGRWRTALNTDPQTGKKAPARILPGVSGLHITVDPSGVRDWDIRLDSPSVPDISSYLSFDDDLPE